MASHNLLHQGMASHNGSEISVLISKVAWFTTGFQKTAGFWNLSLLEVTGCPLVGASSCERPIKVTGQHQFWGTAADVAAGRDKMKKETTEQWQA